MKKVSKMKKFIIAAMCAITGLCGAASVAGTYAWFVASNVVTVTGPTVKAMAEEGIVIAAEKASAYVDADWKQDVSALYTGAGTSYIPTSTKDAAHWYHGNSENVDAYAAGTNGNAVTEITDISVTNGVASSATLGNKNVYLLNKFKIQSAVESATGLTGQDIVVKTVTAEQPNTPNSAALNKSLRVLIKGVGGNTVIFAPLATGASVIHDGTNADGKGGQIESTTVTAYKAADRTRDILFSNITIPGYITTGNSAKEIYVYVYFEGEDFNCKSANIKATLDEISLSFEFENKPYVAPANP